MVAKTGGHTRTNFGDTGDKVHSQDYGDKISGQDFGTLGTS